MFEQLRLGALSREVRRRQAIPLRIELWDGRRIDFSAAAPRVTIRVPSRAALRALFPPSLYRLGRAYVEGVIEVSGRAMDMIAVVHALAHAGIGRAARRDPAPRPKHTPWRDAAAIRYHYDVSDDFYACWLDPAMVYSCAYFEHGDEDLATAQAQKIDHILAKIQLRPGHTLLDVGCGWGALVLRAASCHGARCVGITLSQNQAALARQRVRAMGLQDRVEIRLQDYREVQGRFDRITSVGMFEHVGVQHLPEYFSRLRALLEDDGVAMNHGITSSDPQGGGVPYGGGAFISEYVFPHGELAHLSAVIQAMQQGGLEVMDVENLRRHYARTCALWSEAFEADAARLRTMVDAKTFRIWQVFLAGCHHAFTRDWISLYQVVARPAGSDASLHPWSRRYAYPCPAATFSDKAW
jgi:cyclopropane-fatty-acyl-phospholipid synthase